jgi:hypothetical protein
MCLTQPRTRPYGVCPSVHVVLGLFTDLARTQLGHRWLVKQSIHQNSVRVQSEHSPWTVHRLHRVRTESVWIRWGSVKTSSKQRIGKKKVTFEESSESDEEPSKKAHHSKKSTTNKESTTKKTEKKHSSDHKKNDKKNISE